MATLLSCVTLLSCMVLVTTEKKFDETDVRGFHYIDGDPDIPDIVLKCGCTNETSIQITFMKFGETYYDDYVIYKDNNIVETFKKDYFIEKQFYDEEGVFWTYVKFANLSEEQAGMYYCRVDTQYKRGITFVEIIKKNPICKSFVEGINVTICCSVEYRGTNYLLLRIYSYNSVKKVPIHLHSSILPITGIPHCFTTYASRDTFYYANISFENYNNILWNTKYNWHWTSEIINARHNYFIPKTLIMFWISIIVIIVVHKCLCGIILNHPHSE